jgi:hypothetical protein
VSRMLARASLRCRVARTVRAAEREIDPCGKCSHRSVHFRCGAAKLSVRKEGESHHHAAAGGARIIGAGKGCRTRVRQWQTGQIRRSMSVSSSSKRAAAPISLAGAGMSTP